VKEERGIDTVDAAPMFSIRRLRSADLRTVAGFECEIARISFPEDPVTEISFYEPRLAKFIDDPHAGAFVAENASGIIGWALVTRRENFVTKERYGDFRSLYVAPSQRGAGVAFSLMRRVLEFCVESKFARVVGRTSATNEAMRAIYQGFGFKAKHIVYEREVPPDHKGAGRK
jgi:ribosomal protein S18 acetylase RimI-like enzyme